MSILRSERNEAITRGFLPTMDEIHCWKVVPKGGLRTEEIPALERQPVGMPFQPVGGMKSKRIARNKLSSCTKFGTWHTASQTTKTALFYTMC